MALGFKISKEDKSTDRNKLILVSSKDIQDLKVIRNYFGEHSETIFEHFAYSFLDELIKTAR